ncbi:tetratricopeptide repeat protein, partial [Thermodesulfobacteriota bacterium]
MRHSLFQLFFLLNLIGAAFLLPSHGIANDSILIRAKEYYQTGHYSEALTLFQKADGADLVPGVIGASRTLAMIGNYAEAESICRNTLTELPGEVQITCRLAEVLAETGRSDEAMRLLEPVVNGTDPALGCLVQYGKLLRMRGRRDEAVSLFERVVARYNNGLVSDSEDLALTGVANWALERFHDANRLFREALRADPRNLAAQVLWGD